MPRLTLCQAQTLAGGRIRGLGGDAGVAYWAFDTRLPFQEVDACFLALAGPNRSGVMFIEQALSRGVKLFCVAEKDEIEWQKDATYWIVEDVLKAIQLLASKVRREQATSLEHVVGITGSNGKTIVKEWLYSLLGGSTKGIYRSPSSFNSQLGVALSILHMPTNKRIAILEAGISKSGEMQRLEAMIAPTLGLLTNIGSAHAVGFSGSEEKIKEKTKLFQGAKEVVYQAGNPKIVACMRKLKANRFAWSETIEEETAMRVTYRKSTFLLHLTQTNKEEFVYEFPLPFSDAASIENLTNAVIMALRCGQPAEEISARIPTLRQTDLRLSLTAGRQGCRLIDDTYNADIEGLEAALQFFSQHIQPNGQRIVVLGPLLESGLSDVQAAKRIIELLAPFPYDVLLTVGDALKPLAERHTSLHFTTIEQLTDHLLELDLSAATILIKGPRTLQLDRVSNVLKRQSHPVRLEINLDVLAENLAVYRSKLRPETKICVMLKASAYGSGSLELVRFFEQRGIDYLAVANVDEAVELRKAGTELPIIVANAQKAEWPRVQEFDLDVEVTNFTQLYELASARSQLRVHLKLDTGMHRLGFIVDPDREDDDLAELLELLKEHKLTVVSVFSHLVASNLATGDSFSRKQNDRLIYGSAQIERVLGYRPMIHLLNSSGALRLPEFQHDMVRLGIGIYGIGASQDSGLSPAHRLLAQVVQIKKVKAGEYVGYGLHGQSTLDRKIGVVNIGYADGFRREAGHGAYSLAIKSRCYPTVGSICMDFCMVDLSEAEDVEVGDEVEVFGGVQSITGLARILKTIPYEVLTGIGQRVQRVYYR